MTRKHSKLKSLKIQSWREAQSWEDLENFFKFLGPEAIQFFLQTIVPHATRRDITESQKVARSATLLCRHAHGQELSALRKVGAKAMDRTSALILRRAGELVRQANAAYRARRGSK